MLELYANIPLLRSNDCLKYRKYSFVVFTKIWKMNVRTFLVSAIYIRHQLHVKMYSANLGRIV